jgi:hypothetical protein
MDIETAILDLLARRAPGKSICPSEVVRMLADDWRPLMPEIRRVAKELAAEGRLCVLQKGLPVDPTAARGPIRLSLP